MNLANKLSTIVKTVFPATKTELYLFLIFVLIYGANAWYIADNFRIVFDDRIPWDAYFSFDNRAIVNTGGGFERHPLANYFFDAIRELALLISNNQYNSVFRIVLSLLSAFAISLANIQVFKYLSNIIQLPLKISLLIILFYAFFVTNILLSFTPETYTYTLLILTGFNYYAAKKIKDNKTISFGATLFGSVFVGGLTITNIVKVYIPLLFEKHLFWNWRKIGIAISKVFASVFVFGLLFLCRINFDFQKFFTKTEQQYDKFSNPKITPIWDMISSWFFGGNILFSNFITRDYHNKKGFEYKALFMDVYSSSWSYVFVAIVLLLIIWSIFKNLKNKLVWILVLSFMIDIIIHCILKFGLHTSYIYGGHFVFVFPMLIGWLFFSYKKSPKMLSFIYGMMMFLTLYLIINNLYRLSDFYQFVENFYS